MAMAAITMDVAAVTMAVVEITMVMAIVTMVVAAVTMAVAVVTAVMAEDRAVADRRMVGQPLPLAMGVGISGQQRDAKEELSPSYEDDGGNGRKEPAHAVNTPIRPSSTFQA